MQGYWVSEEELSAMIAKTAAAQTLLNVNCVALLEGRQPVPAAVRLDLAEEAEDLVHDLADMLDEVRRRG